MRMVKMKQNHITLEACVKKFLLVKEAQHTGEEAMRDYRNCLARFTAHSHNSLDYSVLENDVLSFFSAIPDTSPARYNKPFQNVNAFLNWLVEQGYLSQSPNIVGGTSNTGPSLCESTAITLYFLLIFRFPASLVVNHSETSRKSKSYIRLAAFLSDSPDRQCGPLW